MAHLKMRVSFFNVRAVLRQNLLYPQPNKWLHQRIGYVESRRTAPDEQPVRLKTTLPLRTATPAVTSAAAPAPWCHQCNRHRPLRSRCAQPGQQHGRRIPSLSSSSVRRTLFSRVTSCLASDAQQMNSLRAKGVMLRHAARATEARAPSSAARRSAGKECTVPPGTEPPRAASAAARARFGRSGGAAAAMNDRPCLDGATPPSFTDTCFIRKRKRSCACALGAAAAPRM
jgi:hypothetical protein